MDRPFKGRLPLSLLAAAIGTIVFLLACVVLQETNREFSNAHFLADTEIRGDPLQEREGRWVYRERLGGVVMVFSRGMRRSRFETDTGWSETLVIEWPHWPNPGTYVAGIGGMRIGFSGGGPFSLRTLGDLGVRGTIKIEEASADSAAAVLDLTVDAVTSDAAPQHSEKGFHSRWVMHAAPRPPHADFFGPLFSANGKKSD